MTQEPIAIYRSRLSNCRPTVAATHFTNEMKSQITHSTNDEPAAWVAPLADTHYDITTVQDLASRAVPPNGLCPTPTDRGAFLQHEAPQRRSGISFVKALRE